ncbi:MAG: tungsten formylmethanofuran dehydrogenase [Nitrospirae bacterium RBG_19FT_COMBO_42_15]|nr:MAG: tungsten formylmethanofuran dehydrogenase [Nitrospirae bacterium RBG_19FT_COMBO_42_15]
MSYIIVNKEWCKGCELCVVACPKKIIALEEGFNSQGYHPAKLIDADKCTGCAMCAEMCPDMAIEVYKEEKVKSK